MDALRNDFRFAVRGLMRSPGYALAAIVALAVGIGANVAVFSVVDGVLFKALPYKDPPQLVLLFEQLPGAPVKFGFSPPDFEIVKGLARSFSGFAAYRTNGYELSGTVVPQRLIGARVTPDLFSVLDVEPALGRALTDDDDRQNAQVAMVTHSLWTDLFGRDPSVVGRTISLDGRPYVIVGVLAERFVFPPRGAALNGDPADVFIPMSFTSFERQAFGMLYNNTVVARLRPDVSIERARAELSTLIQPLVERYPPALHEVAARQSIPIVPMNEETVGSSRRLLLIVMGAVVLVLLITCADVAGLILTRSASRQRELAIRTSLGATAGRIVRQLLTEAFVLATAGSALGLILAYSLMRGLLSLAGDRLPRADSIAFDLRIVIFTLTLAFLTPLIFGSIPALRTARGTDGHNLDLSGRGGTSGRRKSWLLGSLVVAQFAVALVLAVSAGLLVRSFVNLVQTDPGFRPEQSVRATVTLPGGRYRPPEVKAFYQRSIDSMRAVPSVVSAGAGNDLPLGVRERRAFSTDPSGRPIPEPSRFIAPTWTAGSYFDALGIPLRRGRFFTDADGPDRQRVVIVNEQFARVVWPREDALGHQIRWGFDVPRNQSPWMTIVGVVGDVKQAGLETPAIPKVYVPLAQDDTVAELLRTVNLVVRSPRDAGSVMADVRTILRQLDSSLPITVQTLDEMVGATVQPQRFSMSVMTAFASLGLMLAALGVYGVLASAVAQQTREIAVRVALGATRPVLVWMVLRRAVILAMAGVVIGTAGALAATRTMESLLFGVRPTDALTFAGATASLAALALCASLVPAWRAIKVDPNVALKAE